MLQSASNSHDIFCLITLMHDAPNTDHFESASLV